MRVCGLDFTSSPTSKKSNAKRKKRLMLAACTLDGGVLNVDEIRPLNGDKPRDFSAFEILLHTEGEWIAGFDFPFGQPAQLVRELNWSQTWAGYVAHVASLKKKGFEKVLTDYKASKPPGHEELQRATDKEAGSVSPMKLYGVPVGKMFFEGATRLLSSSLSIRPVRPIETEHRIVTEAYPALVARKWIGERSYKEDNPDKWTDDMRLARCDLVNAIRGISQTSRRPTIQERYGFDVAMDEKIASDCINDGTGDSLDSVLCAIQAAWAHNRSTTGYGIPANVDLLEGWIVDPELLTN